MFVTLLLLAFVLFDWSRINLFSLLLPWRVMMLPVSSVAGGLKLTPTSWCVRMSDICSNLVSICVEPHRAFLSCCLWVCSLVTSCLLVEYYIFWKYIDAWGQWTWLDFMSRYRNWTGFTGHRLTSTVHVHVTYMYLCFYKLHPFSPIDRCMSMYT